MGIHESDRITAGLRYVAEEVSVHRDDFRRDQHPGGSALLEGCESLGYLRRGKSSENCERFALTAAGQRRLQAAEPAPAGE